jgi:hypothetical protein
VHFSGGAFPYNEPAANATFRGTEGWLFYVVTDAVGLAITDRWWCFGLACLTVVPGTERRV